MTRLATVQAASYRVVVVCVQKMGGAAAVVLILFTLLTTTACEIVFEVEPEDVLAAAGTSVRFDCTFTTTSPASLSWLHDGAVITLDTRYTYHSNGSLQISPGDEEAEGLYTCRVTDTITEDVHERTATLTLATIIDSFLVAPDSTTVDEGDPLQLFCIHSGSLPAADITWLLGGNSVMPSFRISLPSLQLSGTDPPQTSSSLYISSAEPSDAGSYVCEARNELLPDTIVTSNEGVVTVIGIPRAPTITEQPSDVTAVPGNTATLTCSADGQPSPSFTWYHDGDLLTAGEVSISSSGGRSTLSVSDVGEEEEGEYHCQAENTQGTANSNTAELMLAYLDSVFQLSPQSMVATTGTDARFDCLPPDSNPSASVSWTKDFAQLPNSRFSVLTNGSLLITSVALGDGAVYHCVATNDLLEVSSTSSGAQLIVLSTPTVTPDTISVSIGHSATFLCEAPGSPPPSLTWYNGTTEITPSTPRTTLTTSTLTLENIVREDRGEYVCTAAYPNGTTRASATLLVNAPPLFVDSFVSLITIEGQEVTLPCHTLPDHTLTFTWSFNGISISLPSDDEEGPTLLSNGSLVYASVVEEMEGNYTCGASNSLGTADGTVQLTVLVPPSLSPSPPTVTITEGTTAVLTCTVSGDPVPVLMWYYMGTAIAGENEASLVLEEVLKEQEGQYECAASNQAGDDRATVTLVVNTHPTVEASPSLLELLIGSTAVFLCLTTGDPAPLITWYNENNVDVTTLGDSRVQIVGETLSISGITGSDSQIYTCTASNTVGSNSTTVELNVLVPPAVSLPPSLVASQGDPLSLDCSASGNPTPSVLWYKDGQLLSTSGRVTVSSPGRVVVISSLYSTDEGNYTCVASNSQGTARATTHLTVLVIPVIHAGVSMVTVNEGDTAILHCNATGNPPPTVSWFHSSLPVPEPGDTRLLQAENGSLLVTRAGSEDEGEYVCQATNIAGSETATLHLVVNIGPTVTALENFITVVQGSEVTLSCTATGQPTPSVTWQRNGGEVPTDSTPNLSSVEGEGAGSLTISAVGVDEGAWVCVGTNSAGSSQQTIMLSVLVPPTITSLLPSVTITEGTPHTLTCTATGEPLPLISWSRGCVVLSTQGSLSFESGGVQRSDAGVYTCTATNTAGSDSRNTTVDVHYGPTITQSPISQTAHFNSLVQFECIADGNPDPAITWEFQGALISGVQGNILTVPSAAAEEVGTYTCVASNTVGEERASATLSVLFPPSAPVLQGAIATSSTTISLQWAASDDDGGSPLVNYIIEYRLSDEIEFSDITTTSADTLSMTITGLTPYGQYEVRVRGENAVGRGAPSNSLLARTHPDAPSAPRDFRVVSSTPSSLSLAWALPDPLNGLLAAYQLLFGEEDTFDTQHQTRLLFTTQYVVVGLEEGVTYLLRLRASTISLGGESLWGPYSLLRVRDGETLEIPTLPPSPTPTPSPSPSLTPSPSPSSVLASPTSHDVPHTTPALMSSATVSSLAPTSSPLSPSSQLSPLTSSPSSQISLPTTMSSSKLSTTSVTLPVSTSTPSPSPPPPPPTATPTDLSLSATGVGTITVSWKPPLTGVDSIDGYAVFLTPSPPHPLTTPILLTLHQSTLTNHTLIITNLTSFTDYTVVVATYNGGGVGPLSLSGVIKTVETAPTAPRNVTVTIIEETTILVTWLPPEATNGIIISYTMTVVVNSTGEEVFSLSLPITTTSQLALQSVSVPGLELDSVRYRITVEAATRAGTGPPSEPVYVGTDVLPTLTEASRREKDAGYYTVRILPPLLGVAFIGVAVVMLVLFWRYSRNHQLRRKRKGMYRFSGTDNGSEFELGTKVNSDVVAADDVETSVYYVKNALDANVTYAAGPQVHTVREREERERGRRGEEEGGGWEGQDEEDDVDMPGFHPSDEELIGQERDALQESPSHAPSERPDSLEFPSLPLTHTSPPHPLTPSHLAGSGAESTGSIGGESQDSLSRPTFQPGDYSYEELDAIRARKVRQREKRFRKQNPESTGYSSGGLMETRIGAVGNTGGGTGESPLVKNGHITPAELAHMY